MTSGARLISYLSLEVKFNLTKGLYWDFLELYEKHMRIQGSWRLKGRRVAWESEESDKNGRCHSDVLVVPVAPGTSVTEVYVSGGSCTFGLDFNFDFVLTCVSKRYWTVLLIERCLRRGVSSQSG